jgi:hypothetical protein
MIKIFLLLPAFFLTGSSYSKAQFMPDSLRVIFSEKETMRLPVTADYSKRFTPSLNQINTADSIIKSFLLNKPFEHLTSNRFESYYRQYAGNMQGGQNFLYVIGSCDKPEYFSKRFGLFMMGGGSCYFTAIISLLNMKVLKFAINAPK